MYKINDIKYSVKRYGRMNNNFTQIPNDIFAIINNGNQFMVYCYLCRMHNRDYQYAFPKVEQIANDCGISASTVKRCIKELEGMHLIKILKFTNKTSNFVNNMYYVFYPILNLDSIGDRLEEEMNNEIPKGIQLEIEEVESQTFEMKNGKISAIK